MEQSIDAYLKDPSADSRNELLAVLERLDQQIERSDAYESSIIGSAAFGYSDEGSVIGEIGSASPAEDIPQSVLQAQSVLIRAAKREATAPTPDTLADLRAAHQTTESGDTPTPGEPGGDDDVLVSDTTATPTQSRTSLSASLGTMKDARKIGKNLFPVHRKATISPSAASKVSVLLDSRPLRTCRGMTSRLDWYLDRMVHFDRPDPLAADHDIVRATTYLRSDCLMRQLQRCRHLLISS